MSANHRVEPALRNTTSNVGEFNGSEEGLAAREERRSVVFLEMWTQSGFLA
jgi:hypothetical protein